MDEIYVKVKDLNDFKYVKDYFYNQDIISIGDILSALDYELEKQELSEKISNGCELSEEELEHYRRNYE